MANFTPGLEGPTITGRSKAVVRDGQSPNRKSTCLVAVQSILRSIAHRSASALSSAMEDGSHNCFSLVWSNTFEMSQNEARASTLSTLRSPAIKDALEASATEDGHSAATDDASDPSSDAARMRVPPSRHGCGGRELRVLPPVLLGLSLLACSSAQAKLRFNASEIVGRSSEVLNCDLDGDGLKDLVLMDDLNLSICYQDPKRGFTREPQQSHRLEHRPCIVWAAKLGKPAESLLVMTSDGVTELCFTNRIGPPATRQIIRQPTIVPGAAENTNAMYLPLSVETGLRRAGVAELERAAATQAGRAWPLLLVPAADGLQVWSTLRPDSIGTPEDGQHRDEWHQAQFIGHSIDARLRPSLANPGYTASLGFNLSVGDVNGDGRDDLIVRRSDGRTNTYSLYLQKADGLFAVEPVLTYADKIESHAWLCWVDLNHDGNVDLIKSLWLNEPSFLPGHPSGKVLVRTYVADERGRIPAEPQQVFRKNDWTPALPVVDVDGDGFLDLALGYSLVDSREGVRKTITAKQLDYSLRFSFYRPGVGFPKEADCQRDVVIHLDQATLLLSWGRREYFERYVKLGGDFNGDGKTDLLVRDRSDEISVYFFVSRQKGFSSKPDLRFSCPELIDEWEVKDLNNDGVSDAIVKLGQQNAFRVFISQK
jgi:hypothetical protein